MEAFTNTFPVSGTDPLTARTPGPGPVFNVLNPTVAITSIGGQAVPVNPQGVFESVTFDMAAGSYFIEAHATFATP